MWCKHGPLGVGGENVVNQYNYCWLWVIALKLRCQFVKTMTICEPLPSVDRPATNYLNIITYYNKWLLNIFIDELDLFKHWNRIK